MQDSYWGSHAWNWVKSHIGRNTIYPSPRGFCEPQHTYLYGLPGFIVRLVERKDLAACAPPPTPLPSSHSIQSFLKGQSFPNLTVLFHKLYLYVKPVETHWNQERAQCTAGITDEWMTGNGLRVSLSSQPSTVWWECSLWDAGGNVLSFFPHGLCWGRHEPMEFQWNALFVCMPLKFVCWLSLSVWN